jgi:leader peptidase (prepilin peptidase)/N-methyltransferase
MALWQGFFFSLPGLIFAACYGAAVGSFLNVVAYRLPRGISIVSPRSRCPRCASPIRPWHNLPILGWLALGGRCRDCRLPIAARYPLVETAAAAIFALSFLQHPSFGKAALSCFAGAWILVLALIDLDLRVLPDSLTLPAIAVFLAGQAYFAGPAAFADALAAAAAAFLLFDLLSRLWRLVRREPGFGEGDGRFAAALGALFGSQGLVLVLPLAALVALLLAGLLALALRRGDPHRDRLPFGSALGIAAICFLLGFPAPGAWP